MRTKAHLNQYLLPSLGLQYANNQLCWKGNRVEKKIVGTRINQEDERKKSNVAQKAGRVVEKKTGTYYTKSGHFCILHIAISYCFKILATF